MERNKIITKSYLILTSLIIIIGISFWAHDQYIARKEWRATYRKVEFNGIIKDTFHYEMEHDMPTYVFTNHSSHLSEENEAYIHMIAKAGDSLNKISGNDTVYVFRKNTYGQFVQVYPSLNSFK